MGHIPVAKPSPILRRWTFPKRGLAVALVLVSVLAVGGVMLAASWPTGSHVDQSTHGTWVTVGREQDLEVDQPVRVIEQRLWLVKLKDGEIIALSQRSTHRGCTVGWRPDMVFDNKKGWFRDVCSGSTWDLNGYKEFGPAPRGLDQYQVRIQNGFVQAYAGKGAPIIMDAPIEAKPYR